VNPKKIWIYLSILMGVIVVWLAMERVFPKKIEEGKHPALFGNLEADKVKEIRLERGQEQIALKNTQGWRIESPISVNADDRMVADILQTLTTLSPERILTGSDKALKEFGLDSPKLKIHFLSQGRWLDLVVGNKTAVGTSYYAKASTSQNPLLINEYQFRALDRSLFDLRNKKLFSFSQDQVQFLEIRQKNKTYILVKDSKGWQVKNQAELRLNSLKVNTFIGDLFWVRVTGFDGGEGKEPTWGLGHLQAQIILGSDKNRPEEILKIGNEVPSKGLCAWSSHQKEVLFLEPSFLKKIPGSLEEWEDNMPLPHHRKVTDG
jgi:hypothetical protein